jgi:flagellar hook-basal body complex protein FliE
MVLNIGSAISAYKQSGASTSGASATSTVGGGENGSFMDMVKDFSSDAVKSLEAGEKASTAAASGKGDIASVVTAMNSAELMLQTVVTIRDKVIAAYEDITKTAI